MASELPQERTIAKMSSKIRLGQNSSLLHFIKYVFGEIHERMAFICESLQI